MAKRRKNRKSKFAKAGTTMRMLGFKGDLSSKSYNTLAKRKAWIKKRTLNPRRRKNYGLVPRTPAKGTNLEVGIGALILVGWIGYAIGQRAKQRNNLI